jgi:hypothetical protein
METKYSSPDRPTLQQTSPPANTSTNTSTNASTTVPTNVPTNMDVDTNMNSDSHPCNSNLNNNINNNSNNNISNNINDNNTGSLELSALIPTHTHTHDHNPDTVNHNNDNNNNNHNNVNPNIPNNTNATNTATSSMKPLSSPAPRQDSTILTTPPSTSTPATTSVATSTSASTFASNSTQLSTNATSATLTTTTTTPKTTNSASRLSQSREENWENMFNALAVYKQEHGHCLVPKCFPDNKSLSHWVYRQRSLFMTRQRKGERKNTLTPERTERLRNLGFVFRARSTKEQSKVESIRRQPSSDANWMRNFEILKEFRERMGHTLVPKVYKENQTFSSWVYTQRHLYKKRKDGQMNVLIDDRIKILDSINFVWNAKKDRQWQDKDRHRKIEKVQDLWQKYFNELVHFKEIHGHTMVPKVYKSNQALSSWVFRQRKHYRLREEGLSHSMTDDRFQQLVDIKFQFRVRGPRAPNKKKATAETESETATNVTFEESQGEMSAEMEEGVKLPGDHVGSQGETSISNDGDTLEAATAAAILTREKEKSSLGSGFEEEGKGGAHSNQHCTTTTTTTTAAAAASAASARSVETKQSSDDSVILGKENKSQNNEIYVTSEESTNNNNTLHDTSG